MDQKNDLMAEDVVVMLLDTLKSNGTFDEFRRHCVSDIDAKPTYQNWKQRIESNVSKFLSKVKYTPELNKNTVRERLRKHLLDGRETHDIEEGADRILTQVLAPRMLSVFEPKIANAVNEYLGIKSEVPLIEPRIELNGLKESNMNMKNVSGVEINVVSNNKIDLISDTENMDNIEETSPEFEPLSSVFNNDNSNDESISGMSDLVSVGSPIQLIPKENHEDNSNGFESDKNAVEKPHQTIPLDKNGIINHKNDTISIKTDDVKILNNNEKPKTNDSKPKNKHHSSKSSRHSNSLDKSSTQRSKDNNSIRHRSTSQEKNDMKKSNNSSSKDRKNSSHNKHHNDSKNKEKKHRHDKKSHHSDRDKTPKRDRKDSRSDKKEKSSSLCKEPKSLNGNRSDDESNSGGSSKQKSNLHKNKSSSSDKSRSSSSNHKSSRKDNGSKDVVGKSKDKSSMAKNCKTSNHKTNRSHLKKRKHSSEDKNKLPKHSSNVEEKKPKWSDFITNDEQDAANVLLSMSEISYESSISEIITENIIFVDNSPPVETLKMPLTTIENKLEDQNHLNPIENVQSTDKCVEENFNLQTNNLETPQLFNPDDNYDKLDLYSNNIVNCSTPNKNISAQNSFTENVQITSDDIKPIKLEVEVKEIKPLNDEVNLNPISNQMTQKCDSNENLKVPKLKLKLLPNQIDSIKREKRKKHKNNESKIKKLKPSKSYELLNECIVPVIHTTSTTLSCEPNDQEKNQVKKYDCDVNSEIINSEIDSPPNQEALSLHNKDEIITLENEESCYTFKGFTPSEAVPCKHYKVLKDLIKSLQTEINNQKVIDNEGFKGFTCADIRPCENRDIVHSQLVKLKENLGFKGFSKEEIEISSGHQFVKQQLKLAETQIYENNQQINISGNGVQQGKTFNEVMAIIYESKKDNDTNSAKTYSQPIEKKKKDSPAVDNNNHDIAASDDWVVEQEMKYKLLPVKVQLERLLEYSFNDTKRMPDSPQVSSTS